MTPPTTDTWILIAVQVAVYLGFWLRKNQKTTIEKYQHAKMWKQFEKDHGINGNGITEEL